MQRSFLLKKLFASKTYFQVSTPGMFLGGFFFCGTCKLEHLILIANSDSATGCHGIDAALVYVKLHSLTVDLSFQFNC